MLTKISMSTGDMSVFTYKVGHHTVCGEDTVVDFVPVESVAREQIHDRHLSWKQHKITTHVNTCGKEPAEVSTNSAKPAQVKHTVQ